MSKWTMAYVSMLEGSEGRARVVEFRTWSEAIKSALNLATRGYSSGKPLVRKVKP